MIKFRNNKFYGNAGHKPAEIFAYEVLNLGNVYILEELLAQVEDNMRKVELADARWLLAAIKSGAVKINDETMDYNTYLCVFDSIIAALQQTLGINIRHLMWLGDLEDILELYSDGYTNYLEAFEAYETGTLIYEVPCDGCLYAYNEKPKPLSKDVVKDALDNAKGLYKVYVHPGIGYELQTIYFNHCNVSLEEIAAYCVYNNVGWTLTEDEYKETIKNYKFQDKRFVYVDLSSEGLENHWLFVENMICDDNTEIYM